MVCLVATDDEAYTYNKRVNRLAIIQEHRMILTALQKGVSEERLARALNLTSRVSAAAGACSRESARRPPSCFGTSMSRSTHFGTQEDEAASADRGGRAHGGYGQVHHQLCALTGGCHPEDQLVEAKKRHEGLTPEQIEKMETEAANLQREFS